MEEMRKCTCCGEEKPITEFSKNGWGVMSVCKECVKKNRQAKADEKKKLKQQAVDAVNARNLRLKDFTARELMLELKMRGYDGKIVYVERHEIDLKTL